MYVCYPENCGKELAIDETSLGKDLVVTIVTNKEGRGGKGSLVAMVTSLRSANVVEVLETHIPAPTRNQVKEVTTDLSSAMMSVAQYAFPNATLVNDRFHVQQIVNESAEDIRREAKREAQDYENKEHSLCQENDVPFFPSKLPNGETVMQALSRSRLAMLTWRENWSPIQETRMMHLFTFFPNIETAYNLIEEFRKLFNLKLTVNEGLEKIREWCDRAFKEAPKVFRTAVNTIKQNIFTIANYFKNRATNAFAESFNAKLKQFRAQLRGVNDFQFFIFRVSKLFA